MIRDAVYEDLKQLLTLYLDLHETDVPRNSSHLQSTWERILGDANHHVIVLEEEGRILSSCVCVVIPNLTRGVRPYALVENVVTHRDHRGKGYASACLAYAKRIAKENGCYKLMLLTGAKEESTLDFYRKAGFNSSDKTAFIQWFDK